MASFLAEAFATITANLPSVKVSNWTVKVKKERQLNPLNADGLYSAIKIIKNDIRWAQEQIAGIFQYTDPDMLDIAEFDSFISFNGQHTSQIVKNAIENGAFRSVNKLKEPNKVIIELAKGGYRSGIEEVLTSLKKYQNSTAVCSVYTPFGVLEDLNLIGLEYNFTTDNGSNLLIAKLTFQEVMYKSKNKNKKNCLPGLDKIEDMGRKALQGLFKKG